MKTLLKRSISFFLATLFVCLSLVGCSNSNNDTPDNTKRTVVDMTGKTIELPKQVSKVFCDWQSGTTLVMTLGATKKLVAVHSAFDSESFAWARSICPDINGVPRDDDPFTNIESILNYSPDLVITNLEENIEAYNNLGLTTIYVDYSDGESFKKSMMIVGAALGEAELEAATKYNDYFDGNLKMVEERLANVSSDNRPNVYYMDSRFGDAYHTVGRGEIQEDWIVAAGANLATAQDFEGRNLEINAEKLLTLDPDYILIGAQKQAEVYDLLLTDELLSGLTAIKDSKVCRIPQGIFPWCRTGPEAAIQVVWAAKLFYPELFEDVDIAEFAKEFYFTFYGNNVSDTTIQDIISGKLHPAGK